jgi:molecular chaperone DnaK
MSLTRAKLEQLVDSLVERTRMPCETALKDAKLSPNEVDEVILVGGMTRMPLVQSFVKEFFGKDPHKGVNPDEVVAVGAAIQGGVLGGEVKDVLLLDVTPLSLGIETLGGVMTKLIERNTTIPTSKKEIFSTASDSQTAVDIHVLQGEREMANDNRTLGRFQLPGIPPAPRGVPQIEVSFDIDANGILNVSAKDLGTGKEQSIEIKSSSGLSEDEIDRMVTEAESHASEDKERRHLIEIKNQADTQAYQTEKLVKEHGEKLGDDDRKAIDDAVAAVRKAKEGDDASAIEAALEKMQQASYKLSEILYKSQQKSAEGAPEGDAGPTGGKGGDDEVIDADFEVKD